jgi:putative phosphoesterase
VWHAGDWLNLEMHHQITKLNKLIRGVHGNIDGTDVKGYYPEQQAFRIQGLKVLITHIGGRPGKYNPKILPILKNHAPDLFICGHSHILLVKKDPQFDFLFMNPGACGLHGFHKVRTALRFQITEGKIQNLEVVEWERPKSLDFLDKGIAN